MGADQVNIQNIDIKKTNPQNMERASKYLERELEN